MSDTALSPEMVLVEQRLRKQWWELVRQYAAFDLVLRDHPGAFERSLRRISGVSPNHDVCASDEDASAPAVVLAAFIEFGRLDPASLAALGLIARERLRQLLHEGYSVDHDDQHDPAEFANASAAYALCAATPSLTPSTPPCWPWDILAFKPKAQDQDMVRAGALVVAGLAVAIRCGEADGLVDEDEDVAETGT